jgi:hypothetical protein
MPLVPVLRQGIETLSTANELLCGIHVQVIFLSDIACA